MEFRGVLIELKYLVTENVYIENKFERYNELAGSYQFSTPCNCGGIQAKRLSALISNVRYIYECPNNNCT